MKRAQDDAAVAAFIAKGGTITRCPPGVPVGTTGLNRYQEAAKVALSLLGSRRSKLQSGGRLQHDAGGAALNVSDKIKLGKRWGGGKP